MRKFVKKIKNSIWGKIIKLIYTLLKWALEIIIVAIAIIILVQRFSNNEKAFLGYRIFNVATGSMEPDYMVGDILICKEKEPSQIKVGDNVVYLGAKQDYTGKVITHSVVEIQRNEQGEYLFKTKGIANTVEDPLVHQDQVYGTVVSNNFILSFICKVITNRYGLYFCVIVPIVLYLFIGFVKSQEEKIAAEREEERLEELKQQEQEKEKQQGAIEEAVVAENNLENKEPVKEKNKQEVSAKKPRKTKKTEEA